MPITATDTALEQLHYDHLLSEGFTPSHIAQLEEMGVQSLSTTKALQRGFKAWSEADRCWLSSAGLYFPFTQTFGQIRCDTPLMRSNGKPAKYLTPCGAATQAYVPKDCRVITEGFKDALAGSLHGGIETGAVAGVSHIPKALPKGCGHIILFDSDGWRNPQIVFALIKAAQHCDGKIQLVPELPGEPKGGLCEYFKAGYTADDYAKLIDSAMHPDEFLWAWIDKWGRLEFEPRQKMHCTRIAMVCIDLVGAKAA